MSEGALLQRYGVFAFFAALLHLALFLSPSSELSKAQLELHPGSRAVRLRLLNAIPHEQPPQAAAEKMPASATVPEATKASVAPVVEATQPAPMLREVEPMAPVARIENKPSVIPPVSSGALEAPVPKSVQAREAGVVEEVASAAKAEMEPKLDGSKVASSTLSSVLPAGVELEARAMSARIPEYPPRSILRGEEGRVVVRLEVDPEGRAHQIELIEGSGHFRLDRSVLRFVREERFVPAQRGGMPIASTQTFSFRFELRDAPR